MKETYHLGGMAFIVLVHIFALIILPWQLLSGLTVSVSVWIWGAIVFSISGLTLTIMYHRAYSHRSFTINNYFVEGILLFLATLATQGSVIFWSAHHRNHHNYIDTKKDPYSITEGFWHAHIGWMFKKRYTPIPEEVPDLARNKLLLFQHKYYAHVVMGSNALVTLGIGLLTGDMLGAFLVTWMLRQFLSFHGSWFVNSFAHTIGSQRYSNEFSAVDNYFVSLLTFGEGYHNYHHTFATDYRNGIKWYNFDPGKWLVWVLDKVGFVKLKRVIPTTVIMKKLIATDMTLLEKKLDALSNYRKLFFKKRLDKSASELLETLTVMYNEKVEGNKKLYYVLKRKYRRQLRSWFDLSKEVMKVKPFTTPFS